MSHSSFSASERRGIIVIALAALLIIASGIVLGLCGRPHEKTQEIPVVVEHPEMVDSASLEQSSKTETKKKRDKSKNFGDSKKNQPKTYRRRSPLSEPV